MATRSVRLPAAPGRRSSAEQLRPKSYQRRRRTTQELQRCTPHAQVDAESAPGDTRIPVSVLTGFLGSGKSTLLNNILKGNHGKRIAVVENEFGEVDVDSELVEAESSGSENVLMLNNGCLCCTVRQDLVQMLSELVHTKRDSIDAIVIETTGLANPGPIIQTFYLEPELADSLRLDGVVTLVDAKHWHLHLEHSSEQDGATEQQQTTADEQIDPLAPDNEAIAQIAYADRIVLNKADLVDSEQLNRSLSRISAINSMADTHTTEHAKVDTEFVLGIGGFDLERVVNQVDSLLLEEDSHSHEHEHEHTRDHHHEHDHHHAHTHSHGLHNDAVSSVAITIDGEVDIDLVNDWIGALLEDNWQDIYRMKGVLAIEGCDERYVFQGVHALFEGTPERKWGENEKRTNKLVLIGKNLPERAELENAFKDCLAMQHA